MVDVFNGTTIVTEGEGPPGVPGASGVSVSFSNGYHENEALTGVGVVHPLTVTAPFCAFLSIAKPTDLVEFDIRVNTVVVGVASMDPDECGDGPVYVGAVAFADPPLQLVLNDYVDMVCPDDVDATFLSGTLTLAGAQ